ncbi:hypothetical protein BGP_6207 [Beggiatoa sp. PS]|nr:hypothetical protein BGP_6207 [Beggiatoa sp. PS]
MEYVFVNGRTLKAKGQLVGVSEKEIIQAAEKAVQNIKEALQIDGQSEKAAP